MNHHVVIERLDALLVLGRIQLPHRRGDARALEVAREGEREALLVPGRDQDLECEWASARALAQFRSLEFVAGGGEQSERPLEHLAVAARAVAHRRRPAS